MPSSPIHPRLAIRHVGASNLVKRMAEELRLAETIDHAVPGDPGAWRHSPGTLIEALVINILRSQRPLYKVAESFSRLDVPALFGPAAKAEDFNDDALGRALERLAQTDLGQVFTSVSLQAALREGIRLDRLHTDTTSLSVFGAYEAEGAPVNVTYGHSKAKRPDLKQILFGLMVNAEGYPAVGQVRDGNLDDKTWQLSGLQAARALVDHLDPDWLYIADSSLVTRPNLHAIHQWRIPFLSRVPDTFAFPDQLREEAWQRDQWEDLGSLSGVPGSARYKVCESPVTVDGVTYRCFVVRSSELDRRKERKLQRKLEEERKVLEKALAELTRQEFSCEPDAHKALDRFLQEHSRTFHPLDLRVEEKTVLARKRGRPKKGVPPPTRTFYAIEGAVLDPREEALEEFREKEATFVLITNVDAKRLPARQALEEYKGQSWVERRFRFLKDPLFIDNVYLKNQDRVYALGFVFLFALLIASLIELKARRVLRDRQEEIEVHGGRRQSRPTIVSLLEVLNELFILVEYTGRGIRRWADPDTDPRALKILEILGYDLSLYLKPA